MTYTTVPDRIVAGTWAFGAIMTRGDIVIEARCRAHGLMLDKLTDAGARRAVPDGFRVAMDERPRARRRRHAALSRVSRPTCSPGLALAAVSTARR